MLTVLRNVKGYVDWKSLYSETGKVYNLYNYYAFPNTKEHGYFQISPSLEEGFWSIRRKIVEMVEKLPT